MKAVEHINKLSGDANMPTKNAPIDDPNNAPLKVEVKLPKKKEKINKVTHNRPNNATSDENTIESPDNDSNHSISPTSPDTSPNESNVDDVSPNELPESNELDIFDLDMDALD